MKPPLKEILLVFALVLLAISFNNLEFKHEVTHLIKKNKYIRFFIIWASTYTIFYLDLHKHYPEITKLSASFMVALVIYSITL